ncbi:MAG: methyl-accepting chemotaxis protein [Capsulimonadaceae bacterium]|nr:methyl-accepting chemotaxis protein [Capsulimonadaceae bacterium]
MNWFKDLNASRKLSLGFGACILFAMLSGVVAVERMGAMHVAIATIYAQGLSGSSALVKLTSDYKQYRLYQVRYTLSVTDQQRAVMASNLTEFQAKTDQDLSAYRATCPQGDRSADEIAADWSDLVGMTPRIEAVARQGTKAQIERVITVDTFPAYKAISNRIEEAAEANKTAGARLNASTENIFRTGRLTVIALLLCSLVFGFAIASIVTNTITGSLSAVIGRLQSLDTICLTNLQDGVVALAQGDLTYHVQAGTPRLDVSSKDEFGVLAVTLNAMIDKAEATIGSFRDAQASLSKLIGNATAAALTISRSANELAAGNEDLSGRTSEQASSLEETAASMEEMTSIVKQSAQSARRASELAIDARDVAADGGTVVANAVTSMAVINESSRRIADIVSVIDEIAFQTNLLALNAAVEAARVGEQGKGFAVVAAEVRNLASRSSSAAKEIKALVQDSVVKVQEGTDLVNLSGERLKRIVEAVGNVATIVGDISSAAQEQSAGIDQVNKAVIQMDQITQQNAALVEESSACSQAMSHQASELKDLVERFRVDNVHLGDMSTAAAPPVRSSATEVEVASHKTPKLRVVNSHNSFEEF